MGSNLNRWDLEKMNNYCNDNDSLRGYKILELKIVDKTYQK